jgi:hypothetical protein
MRKQQIWFKQCEESQDKAIFPVDNPFDEPRTSRSGWQQDHSKIPYHSRAVAQTLWILTGRSMPKPLKCFQSNIFDINFGI